jgi:DNA-binding CsgD family transcriptional regulator
MPPPGPVLFVLVDATPTCGSIRTWGSAGKLGADDLGKIDSQLEQWLQAAVKTVAQLQQRHSLLTPREREALPLITSGMLNKQAAGVLRISVATLQIHRRRIMRKMAASSFAELVRMADLLGISPHPANVARIGPALPRQHHDESARRAAIEGAI